MLQSLTISKSTQPSSGVCCEDIVYTMNPEHNHSEFLLHFQFLHLSFDPWRGGRSPRLLNGEHGTRQIINHRCLFGGCDTQN